MLYCLLGALVGLAVGLTGAGGSILAVPLLMFAAGLSITQASPVALMAVALAALVGTVTGLRDRTVRYRAAGLIGLAGMSVAPAGLWLAHQLPPRLLTVALVGALLASAKAMFDHSRTQSLTSRQGAVPCYWDPSSGRFVWDWRCARTFIAIGVASGGLSGLLGVGGGFFIVPALSKQSNLPARSVVSTSQAIILLVSSGGVSAALLRGGMNWPVAGLFACSAALVIFATRAVAGRLPAAALQRGFAAFSLMAALATATQIFAKST